MSFLPGVGGFGGRIIGLGLDFGEEECFVGGCSLLASEKKVVQVKFNYFLTERERERGSQLTRTRTGGMGLSCARLVYRKVLKDPRKGKETKIDNGRSETLMPQINAFFIFMGVVNPMVDEYLTGHVFGVF